MGILFINFLLFVGAFMAPFWLFEDTSEVDY